jgi:hypothetical protein
VRFGARVPAGRAGIGLVGCCAFSRCLALRAAVSTRGPCPSVASGRRAGGRLRRGRPRAVAAVRVLGDAAGAVGRSGQGNRDAAAAGGRAAEGCIGAFRGAAGLGVAVALQTPPAAWVDGGTLRALAATGVL